MGVEPELLSFIAEIMMGVSAVAICKLTECTFSPLQGRVRARCGIQPWWIP
jgi:hypothetical protein